LEVRRRTVGQLYERGRFLVVEQDLMDLADPPRPSGVEIASFEGPDWSPLEHLAPLRTLRAFARRDAGDHSRCLVAWRNGRAAGYDWWSRRLDPQLDLLAVPLPPGTAYGHDLYVAAQERSQGIGTALAHERLVDARDQGFRSLRRLIEVGNQGSWRTAQRLGSHRVVGESSFVKTPGRLRVRYSPFERG